MPHTILIVFALVFFVLAALNVPSPRLNLVGAGFGLLGRLAVVLTEIRHASAATHALHYRRPDPWRDRRRDGHCHHSGAVPAVRALHPR